MANSRMPLYLTLMAAVLSVVGLLTLQPYSADWPPSPYAKPARRYIQAALHQDSLELARLSTSALPIRWALNAAREHPDSLASWANHIEARLGQRRGDTVEMFVYPGREPCEQVPIALRFVGSGKSIRVVGASSACLE